MLPVELVAFPYLVTTLYHRFDSLSSTCFHFLKCYPVLNSLSLPCKYIIAQVW
nr:MAG TPA: hypothetical protein [Caudoviricetes sp.]